jgi:WD40 repeat protein
VTIELYSLPKLELVHRLKGHVAKVNAIQFTPVGVWLISASDDCKLKFWQVPAAGKLQPGRIESSYSQCFKYSGSSWGRLATCSRNAWERFDGKYRNFEVRMNSNAFR